MTKVSNVHTLHEGRTAPNPDPSHPVREHWKKARHEFEARRRARHVGPPAPTQSAPVPNPAHLDDSADRRAPSVLATHLPSPAALPQTLAAFLTTLAPTLASAGPALVAGGMPDSGPALVDLAADELDAFIAELGPALTALQRVVLKRRMDDHRKALAAVGANG